MFTNIGYLSCKSLVKFILPIHKVFLVKKKKIENEIQGPMGNQPCWEVSQHLSPGLCGVFRYERLGVETMKTFIFVSVKIESLQVPINNKIHLRFPWKLNP